jgi:nicotinate-nucleotide pyrophosphorylase (carboxylating)
MMFGIDAKIRDWLEEDIGSGDITTEAIVDKEAQTKAIIHAKAAGTLAGVELAERVFQVLDRDLVFQAKLQDGAELTDTSVIATVEGNARAILTGERLALNLMQHLSGVATRTAELAAMARPYGAVLVDTRKTTPGLRCLEKYAVRIGGGRNHRLGLYDAMLIKDNHIKVAGGVKQAVERGRAYASHMTKIEVEVEDMAGVEEALAAGADVIMLDNMQPAEMAACVARIDHAAIVEASGGINETTMTAAAKSGVDVISVGALTHSVKALDISMDIGEIK